MHAFRTALGLALLLVVAAALAAACEDGSSQPSGSASSPVAATTTRAAGASATADFEYPRTRARVTRVVDGDTFEATIAGKKVTVRLIGMDTPETVDPRRPVGCFGREASDHTKQLIAGRDVELEKDVSERDRFGRLLRYVYLPDGSLLNAILLRDGYARVATFPPDVRYAAQFREIETYARESNRGLWGPACVSPTPATSTAFYRNCTEARAAGAAPLRRGQPGYRAELDRDGDGVACE